MIFVVKSLACPKHHLFCDMEGLWFKTAITYQGNALNYHNSLTELSFVMIKLVSSIICPTLVLMQN
jgi:hypothetical protein